MRSLPLKLDLPFFAASLVSAGGISICRVAGCGDTSLELLQFREYPREKAINTFPSLVLSHKTAMWFKHGKNSLLVQNKLPLINTSGNSNASDEQRALLMSSSLPSTSLSSSFLNILQFNKVYFLQLNANAVALYSNPGSP